MDFLKEMKKETQKKINKKIDLELRPHHVNEYLWHETHPELYDLPEDEYIALFRKAGEDPADQDEEGQHIDELIIIYWRDTIKRLHDNPETKFRYVIGLDSVCKKCDYQGICNDKQHEAYEGVKKADDDFTKWASELKPGQVYNSHYLNKLLKKKGCPKAGIAPIPPKK